MAYIYDFPSQRITANGDALASIYGYTPGEIDNLPEGWDSLVHTDDLPRVRAGRESLFTGQSESVSVQMRVACKDGRWEWIQHDWRALDRDAKGVMTRSVGLVQVITPLALSTQALRNEASLNALCRTLVEEWVDGIFLVDGSWRILFANQGALNALGYTQAELHGRSIQYVLLMDSARKKEPLLSKSCQKVTLRGSHIHKDGSKQKVEIVLRRLPGERILVTIRDIREQLAAEEYTRRQAAYYRGLFENNPSGVAVFDTTLQITKVNSALRRMLGYTDRQLTQMRIPDLLEGQNRPVDDFWKQAASSGFKPQKDLEITLKSREGKSLYVHAAVTFLPDNAQESGQGIILFTDISARRQAEQELKRQSQLNDTLVRESAAMIGLVDLEGRILKVNPAVEKISGYTSKELVGKTVWESGLVDPEEIPRARERLKKLQDGAPRVTAISRGRTKSGDLRTIQVHNTATRNADDQIEGYIITAIDITEQQRLQHHLMEAIEQEQARIGHDLHDGVGQLLTGIGALVEMLQLRLSENEKTEAGRIHELVQQAIQQVRQLSRNMSPAAIQHRDLAASLHLLADTVRTSFRRECEFIADLSVKIDDTTQSTHLFRLAQEAINNAIRHGNPTQILISLRQEDASHAVLEIFNNGRPFDCRPGSEGIGLRVMNYRASLIHADFSVNCPPAGGVKVTCKFPLPSGGGTPQATTKTKQKQIP
ncbi:PAS domain S-box protein [Prosthecobacter sp. SYSU 5D2]|uniref:PAS domain-containing sensor histidine kinase n=1 Tax=Prosthecobacter sp. SYSU 5D2 TaxID=3134134 RepID=UPI0031FEAC59